MFALATIHAPLSALDLTYTLSAARQSNCWAGSIPWPNLPNSGQIAHQYRYNVVDGHTMPISRNSTFSHARSASQSLMALSEGAFLRFMFLQ